MPLHLPPHSVRMQASVQALLGDAGPSFITVALVLFAFTTLIGNLFYVNQSWSHIFRRVPDKKFMTGYYIVASLLIVLGAGLSSDLLWGIADVTMGAMTLINVPVLFILGKYAVRALNDYTAQRKAGQDPQFVAKDIGLPQQTDYWND